MVSVDWFSKIARFISSHKGDDDSDIAHLYSKEVIKLQKVPKSIVFDWGTNFLSHF